MLMNQAGGMKSSQRATHRFRDFLGVIEREHLLAKCIGKAAIRGLQKAAC